MKFLALGRVFIPYYTGEVVSAVFGEKASYERLHRTVGIMAMLSLGWWVVGKCLGQFLGHETAFWG